MSHHDEAPHDHDPRPASADEPGVAPPDTTREDGPGGNEAGASSEGDSGPGGAGQEREPRAGDTPPEDD